MPSPSAPTGPRSARRRLGSKTPWTPQPVGPSLTSAADASRRISLGKFLTHEARREDPAPPDMKDKPRAHLLTIPAEGSVAVTHDLPVSRLFRHEDRLAEDDVVGETCRLRLNEGYVGTTWWCWGDLEADLTDKHLSSWHEGMSASPKPEVGEDWVLGLRPMELVFQDQSEDAVFQFVEQHRDIALGSETFDSVLPYNFATESSFRAVTT